MKSFLAHSFAILVGILAFSSPVEADQEAAYPLAATAPPAETLERQPRQLPFWLGNGDADFSTLPARIKSDLGGDFDVLLTAANFSSDPGPPASGSIRQITRSMAFDDGSDYPVSRSTYKNWVSSSIPLDSWIYSALDKLSGLGLIPSALQGSRPYTRMEAARQTLEAWRNSEILEAPRVAMQLVRKLAHELQQQLVEVAALEGVSGETYVKPLGNWEFKYLDKDGEDSRYAVNDPKRPAARVDARQYSLDYNDFGIDYGEGGNARLVFESEARYGKKLLANLRPMLIYRDDGQGNDTPDLELLQGTVSLGFGPLELSVGRQSLWWGQGRHGSLVLTNNAASLDMVRLTNPHPTLLPWFLERLGPFRFDLFLSQLENDRVVPEPYFGGLRLEFKPFPWLNIGGCRTVIFGGQGRPSVGFSDFLTILGGENLSGEKDNSNSIAALDVRLKIPAAWGMELYGELGGEDEAGGFIANTAYLIGLYLPRIEPTGRISLRVEYADLSNQDDNSGSWYRHRIYQSGYTYKNKIMGHHAGGGAEDIFAELEVVLPRDLMIRVSYDYEKRGADQAREEIHRQPSFHLRWDVNSDIFLALDWGYDSVKNFAFVPGRDKDFYMTELTVGGRF